jgi:hypothetical protein
MTQHDWDDAEREALDPVTAELRGLQERHRHDPPVDLLRAARADVLPGELQEKLVEHLGSSAWSRTLAESGDHVEPTLDAPAADRLLARMQREANRNPADEHRGRRVWMPALAVVSLAAILIAVIVWRDSASPTRSAKSPQPPPQSTELRQPTFVLELVKPSVKLTPAALVLRGEGNTGRFVDDVAPGLNAYRDGEYGAAVRALEAVQPRYPMSVEIPFYLGVSRLFLNQVPAAAQALESARGLNDESFNDDAAWYLAVAYERMGARERTWTLLDSLCNGKSSYAGSACAGASRLR